MNLEFTFLSITNEPVYKEILLQHIHDGVYNFPIEKDTTIKELFESFKNRFSNNENQLLAVKNFIEFNEEPFLENLEEYYKNKLVDEKSSETKYYANVYFSKKI